MESSILSGCEDVASKPQQLQYIPRIELLSAAFERFPWNKQGTVKLKESITTVPMDSSNSIQNSPSVRCHKCGQHPAEAITTAETVCCGRPICSLCWADYLDSQLCQKIWRTRYFDLATWMTCPLLFCVAPLIRDQMVAAGVFDEMDAATVQLTDIAYDSAVAIQKGLKVLKREIPELAALAAIDLDELTFPNCLRDIGADNFRSLRYAVLRGDSMDWDTANRVWIHWKGTSLPTFYTTDIYNPHGQARECPVCCETMSEVHFSDKTLLKTHVSDNVWHLARFPVPPDNDCEHSNDTCLSCYRTYLEGQLQLKGAPGCLRLSCPECNRVLEASEIRYLLPKDFMDRLDDLKMQRYLSKQHNFRWCLRPGCGSGAIYESADSSPLQVCYECNFQMCFFHQTAWHTDQTCEEFDTEMASNDPNFLDMASLRLIQQDTKKCPNEECQVRIHRVDGCNYMQCSQCGTEFCWMCFAKFYTTENEIGEEVFEIHQCPYDSDHEDDEEDDEEDDDDDDEEDHEDDDDEEHDEEDDEEDEGEKPLWAQSLTATNVEGMVW
ncbi:hypothetical protein BT63DRAFT_450503 [Microthyrium microscopicum]|uniref:RBR-type E3 ubiquitin transferase n=1 Tax=Microthyrium microscopicum TaxID=703497 RepID=A0A6A6UUR6_9PEZI|nr:hypothetical protein BT63DRAFT_450503 [Microthyrium microscopicum]